MCDAKDASLEHKIAMSQAVLNHPTHPLRLPEARLRPDLAESN
eukprot:gene2877-20820_t